MANPLRFPISLKDIREKVKAYHSKMNAIATALEKGSHPVRIDREKEFIEFYIEKKDLADLNAIDQIPGCARLVVFFGLSDYEGGNSVTGCFLGVDSLNNIIPEHKTSKIDGLQLKEAVPGQDTWLPPGKNIRTDYVPSGNDFTLQTHIDKIMTHLAD